MPEPAVSPDDPIATVVVTSLAIGAATVVRHGRKRIALFRIADAEYRAVDDACPHGNYPLSKGKLRGCAVICPYHNLTFGLDDGACTTGASDSTRTYPVTVHGDAVQIDTRDPDRRTLLLDRLRRLDTATLRGQGAQIARQVAELLQLGTPVALLALLAARYDRGFNHALPLGWDALRLSRRLQGAERTLALMQAYDLGAGTPPLPPADPIDPGPDPVAAGLRLRQLVEDEQNDEAAGLLTGALVAGWGREVIEPWFFGLVCDHFYSYGHPLIYQIRIFDLLAAGGWSNARTVLPVHLANICLGYRDDALVGWRWLAPRLEALAPRAKDLIAGTGEIDDVEPLVAVILDGRRDRMLDALVEALAGGASLEAVVDAIVLAAARRASRYDLRWEQVGGPDQDWFRPLHGLTTANALRHAIDRHRQPEILRLVIWAAWFIHDGAELDRTDVPVSNAVAAPSVASVLAAADRGHDDEAAAIAVAYLQEGGDPDALQHALEDRFLHDRVTLAETTAHRIKVCGVAFEELTRTGRPEAVHALVRFAASPVARRRVVRWALEAAALVSDGDLP